jgi:hypothetical protein
VYCTNCGNQLPPDAIACGNCGTGVPHFPPPPKVSNYLVHSIVATLCCCLPGGIVALVYSAQVNSKLAAGDVAGAQASSKSAKTWVIVSIVGGIVSAGGAAALSLWQ